MLGCDEHLFRFFKADVAEPCAERTVAALLEIRGEILAADVGRLGKGHDVCRRVAVATVVYPPFQSLVNHLCLIFRESVLWLFFGFLLVLLAHYGFYGADVIAKANEADSENEERKQH